MKKENYLLVLVIALLLGACNSGDPAPAYVSADVFVRTKVDGTDTLHAVSFLAYANRSMESVTVETPEGTSITLESPSHKLIYSNQIESDDYVKDFPEVGTYKFDAVFSAEESIEETNALNNDFVTPPEITEFIYRNDSIIATWKNVEKVNLYIMYLMRGDDVLGSIYWGDFDTSDEEHTVEMNMLDYEWYWYVKDDIHNSSQNIAFVLDATMYEDVTVYPFLFHAVASSEKQYLN